MKYARLHVLVVEQWEEVGQLVTKFMNCLASVFTIQNTRTSVKSAEPRLFWINICFTTATK